MRQWAACASRGKRGGSGAKPFARMWGPCKPTGSITHLAAAGVRHQAYEHPALGRGAAAAAQCAELPRDGGQAAAPAAVPSEVELVAVATKVWSAERLASQPSGHAGPSAAAVYSSSVVQNLAAGSQQHQRLASRKKALELQLFGGVVQHPDTLTYKQAVTKYFAYEVPRLMDSLEGLRLDYLVSEALFQHYSNQPGAQRR